MRVPREATVFINGRRTKTTGSSRHYVLRNLTLGQVVPVELRAEVTRNGRKIKLTKKLSLLGGRRSSWEFDFNPETSLTLYVPHDAKVFLADSETTATGSVRVYKTTRLAAGQQRSNYKIRVSVERKGRTLSKEQTILLTSGDATSLTFKFDNSALASAK